MLPYPFALTDGRSRDLAAGLRNVSTRRSIARIWWCESVPDVALEAAVVRVSARRSGRCAMPARLFQSSSVHETTTRRRVLDGRELHQCLPRPTKQKLPCGGPVSRTRGRPSRCPDPDREAMKRHSDRPFVNSEIAAAGAPGVGRGRRSSHRRGPSRGSPSPRPYPIA